MGASVGGWGPPTRAAKAAKSPEKSRGVVGFGAVRGGRGSPKTRNEFLGVHGSPKSDAFRGTQIVGSADTAILNSEFLILNFIKYRK